MERGVTTKVTTNTNCSEDTNRGGAVAVLGSWLYPDAVAAARVAREVGVPVWLRVHGSDRFHLKNWWRRRLILEAVHYAEGVICNAKTVAADLMKYGVPAEKIRIVANGVDADRFRWRSKEEAGEYGLRTTDDGPRNADRRPKAEDHSSVQQTVAESVGIPTVQMEREDGIRRNAATGEGDGHAGFGVAESVGIPMVQVEREDGIRRNAATGEGDGHAGFGVAESVGIPMVQMEREDGIRRNAATPCILFIANLVPVKGPDIMLKAFAKLGERTENREGSFLHQDAKGAKGGGENGGMDGQNGKGGPSTGLRAGGRGRECFGDFGRGVAAAAKIPETISLEGRGARDENHANLLRQLCSSLTQGFANFASMVLRGREMRKTLSSPCLRASVVDVSSLRSLRPSVQTLPHLVIVGSGPMRGKMETMARELGVEERVHFLANRPHAEVALWMNVADVLCLTSRSEGMPNVVAEALASGLPVVATDVGACPEMLEGEPAARVCKSEDVEGLAKAITEVLAMKVDRKAMAERYAGKYSWRKAAETIVGMMRGWEGRAMGND